MFLVLCAANLLRTRLKIGTFYVFESMALLKYQKLAFV